MNKFISFSISLFLLICFSKTLKSQENIFIPYRSGNLWGYADTNSNIVIPPIYDRVIEQQKNMFLVKKEQKEGVVTFENEIIVPFEEKNRISITEEYILSKKVSYQNGQPVVSKIYQSIVSGKKTFPVEFSSIDEIELIFCSD